MDDQLICKVIVMKIEMNLSLIRILKVQRLIERDPKYINIDYSNLTRRISKFIIVANFSKRHMTQKKKITHRQSFLEF